MRSNIPWFLAAVQIGLVCSCGGSDGSPGAGGTAGVGGAAATGGDANTGGVVGNTGGVSASTGGQAATGGEQSSGGNTGAGGAVATGGAVQTGGAVATGGKAQTGGKAATGGTSATAGGTNATSGGSKAGTGGNEAVGGASDTGGATAAGGGKAVGGSKATGGASSTGGGSSTAGASSTGGGGNVVCPSAKLSAGDTKKTIKVGNDNRTYILHVPSAYTGSSAVPLVVDFHPLSGSGQSEAGSSPYKSKTDPEGVISAYPDGKSGPSGNAWNVGPCCVANVDDVAFARALVEDVKSVACIDPKRIYAVGFSMGGGMSHYLACKAADVFAAVAPAAFDLLQENQGSCTPPRPITVVSFRGTSDPIVPYNGGLSTVVPGMSITFLGAKGTHQKWAQINECTGTASAEDSNGCSTYSTCAGGVQVTLCTKQGGGHEAGNAAVGWPILKKYTMP